MKKFIKLPIFLSLILGVVFTSCETTDLDLLNDPNQITTENADLERYMVAIQLDLKSFAQAMGTNGSQLTRINYMFGRTYKDNYSPELQNFEWGLAYRGMFSDIKNAMVIAENNELNKHIGVMKIIKAYTLLVLVDFFGDIPYSQATNLAEYPNPIADDDRDVYDAALAMLDEGIAYLGMDGLGIETDFFYDNDFTKWIKLANTLKMSAYLNMRLLPDSGAESKFNAIVSSGNFITSTADDFQFQYGTNYLQSPNTRHPSYNGDYNVSGAGNYKSNWLMDQMYHNNDPRMRYYFYRQHDCTPNATGADGSPCPPDPQRLFCSTQPNPAHFPAGMIFCSVDGGYWGRDHGNAEGIPPDSFRRTAYGVYPAAGNFDDDRFETVGTSQGGQGAGITPIMLASWVDFYRAEMALASGNAAGASSLMRDGIQKSIDKAKSFASVDPLADLSFEPSAGDISSFVTGVVNEFNGATSEGKWEILATQQFVAHFGNGIDSYNMYRRTGYPHSVQYNIEPSSGIFVRSFFYPADEANTNSNIQQKPDVGVQLFWDTNPASNENHTGFPKAN